MLQANNLDVSDNIDLEFHNPPGLKNVKNKFRKITKFSFQQVKQIDF